MNFADRSNPVSFEQELNHIKSYIRLEELRFQDRIKIEYNISCTEFPVPALSVQPIVENAIKHGICKTKNGGTVIISSFEEDECYTVTVEDTGVGFNPNEIANDGINHIGIESSRFRVEEMLGGTLKIRIPKGGMYVRCFGEFEVFYNGEPLTTLTKRSKELFAYLVDKAGAVCSSTDIINTVFYDNSDAYFRISKKDLETALAQIGEESILIKEWGKLGIRKDKIKCDYFEYLDNNPGVMNLYKGAYMLQYAWAKKTMHRLNKQEAVTQ